MARCRAHLAILGLLASSLVPGTASASTPAGAETRVWAAASSDKEFADQSLLGMVQVAEYASDWGDWDVSGLSAAQAKAAGETKLWVGDVASKFGTLDFAIKSDFGLSLAEHSASVLVSNATGVQYDQVRAGIDFLSYGMFIGNVGKKAIGGAKKLVGALKNTKSATKLEVAAARGGASATKGLQKQLDNHLKKLEDYKANPDKFDNKGFLKDASPELREKIIDGRIRSLEKQIENFRRQIEQGGGGG